MVAQIRRGKTLFVIVGAWLILTVGLISCKSTQSTPVGQVSVSAPTPIVSDINIAVSSTPVSPDTEMGIGVTVDGVGSQSITYTWSVDAGEIVSGQGRSRITYRTPSQPGLANIIVVVQAGEARIERNTSINVGVSPTNTSLSPSELTPMETPGTIQPSTREMTQEPPVTITITQPEKEVDCPEDTACKFLIEGTSTEIASRNIFKIVPFVNPSPGYPNRWFPQWDRPLGSQINADGTWQTDAQIGTDEGVDPGHRFEIVVLVMHAKEQIPVEFQSLPPSITQSSILSLFTTGSNATDQKECPFDDLTYRIPIEGDPIDVEVSITSIENCADNLPRVISLAGTYSGDLTDMELWTLVYPPDLKYFPQSRDACAGLSTQFANGQWLESVILGRPDAPETFHIVIVATDIDSPASEAFHNYLTVGCNTGNYQGFTSIPPGVNEVASIVVHTR